MHDPQSVTGWIQNLKEGDESAANALRQRIDTLCDAFEAAGRAGQKPRIEDHLERIEPAGRPALLKELLLVEWELLEERGTSFEAEEYVVRFPEHKPAVREWLRQRKPEARVPEVIAHYQILKPLGAGGMGEVFLAEDHRRAGGRFRPGRGASRSQAGQHQHQ